METPQQILESFSLFGRITEQHAKDILGILEKILDDKDKEWMLQVKSALDDENKIWQKKAEEARIEQIEKDAKIAKEEFEDMRIDLEVWHGNKIKLKDDCSIANKIRGQLSELETPTEKL